MQDILHDEAARTCRLSPRKSRPKEAMTSGGVNMSRQRPITFSVHFPAFAIDEEWNCTANLMTTRVDLLE